MKLQTAIVDDDRIFHFLMDIMLQETQISNSPVCLYEGEQFLQWWHAHKDNAEASLIFLDLNMPLIDGWKVLDNLRKETAKKIFVVIITSSIDPKDRKRAEGYPMVIDFMVKPIHLNDLLEVKQSAPLLPYF
ncbi:response regulator [Sphingobacterium faecale]|uniref:Response regulator n=1 Tax=Sphingobacterium faecale TaxID=2803775 RepID=A0ABS1R471_9SPHI|nr:response regulator [Sphingobacterium faecale]MBL1409502.1 response regulator [Sphingobacterium faecale]